MDQRREHDPELDRAWREAVAEADRRLSGATGPFDCAAQGGLDMVRRGKNGRLQMVAAGEGRWSAKVEARFLAALRETGNVRASARAVGFSEGAVWDRRRTWPAFAQAMDAMLDEAEVALEFRIAAMANGVVGGVGELGTVTSNCPQGEVGTVTSHCPQRFDMEQAMRFLKWREEKRRGRGGRAPLARPPSIEEVTEKVVRQVAAIKRHAEKEAARRRALEADEGEEGGGEAGEGEEGGGEAGEGETGGVDD
jgi:hypothetical protein